MKPSPAYRAFTVRKATEEGKKDSWVAIGAAWYHRDQKGIDVVLDALPVDGHVVLRVNDQQFSEPRKEKATAPRAPYTNKAPGASYANKAPRANDRGPGSNQRWKRS